MPTGLKLMGVNTPAGSFVWPEDRNYDTLIGANAATKFWLVPNNDATKGTVNVTISGGVVTAGTDRATGLAYTGGPSGVGLGGPSYAAAFQNGRDAIYFDIQGTRRYLTVPNILPWASDFTVLGLVNLDNNSGAIRTLALTSAAGNPSLYMNILGPGLYRLDTSLIDSAGAQIRALSPLNSIPSAGGIVAAMLSWEASSKTLYVSVDMGNSWASATNVSFSSIAGSPVTLQIGTTSTAANNLVGKLLDFWIGNVSLHDTANATLLANFRNYFLDRYALSW